MILHKKNIFFITYFTLQVFPFTFTLYSVCKKNGQFKYEIIVHILKLRVIEYSIHTINVHMMQMSLEFSHSLYLVKRNCGFNITLTLLAQVCSDQKSRTVNAARKHPCWFDFLIYGNWNEPPHVLHLYSALSCFNLISFRISEKKVKYLF